jgi:hypothetical protein
MLSEYIMVRVVDMKLLKNRLLWCIVEMGEIATHLRSHKRGVSTYFSKKQCSLFDVIVDVADVLQIDVLRAVRAKMIRNNEKYPVKLCNGNIAKYTAYTHVTNISKTEGQAIVDWNDNEIQLMQSCNDRAKLIAESGTITCAAIDFSTQRGFDKYETLPNLVFALSGEVAELNDIFLWKDSASLHETVTSEEWDKAVQEIEDVFIYFLKVRAQAPDEYYTEGAVK